MNTYELDRIGAEYAPEMEALFTVSALSQAIKERYGGREWNEFAGKLYDVSAEERTGILSKTISLAGNPQVDQDTRDLAVGACSMMLALEDMDIAKDAVIDGYCQTLDRLSADDDDLGAPYSLLELGKVFESKLGTAATFDESIRLKAKFNGA